MPPGLHAGGRLGSLHIRIGAPATAPQLVGGEEGQPQPAAAAPAVGLLCCRFSPCGRFLVAGGNDCNAYVWQWQLPGSAGAGGMAAPAVAAAATAAGGPSTSFMVRWPVRDDQAW